LKKKEERLLDVEAAEIDHDRGDGQAEGAPKRPFRFPSREQKEGEGQRFPAENGGHQPERPLVEFSQGSLSQGAGEGERKGNRGWGRDGSALS